MLDRVRRRRLPHRRDPVREKGQRARSAGSRPTGRLVPRSGCRRADHPGPARRATAHSRRSLAIARRILARVKVPVVVGVSSPGFASLMQLTQAVMDAGAAGVMVAPPGTLRGDEAISGYCREVGELLGPVPWVLQDFPLAGGPPMSAGLVRRIAKAPEHGRPQTRGLARPGQDHGHPWPGGGRCPPPVHPVRPWRHPPPHELARGADGAMTGFSFPEMLVDVCR